MRSPRLVFLYFVAILDGSLSLLLPATSSPIHILDAPSRSPLSRRWWLASSSALFVFPRAPTARAVQLLSDEYVLVVDDGTVGIELTDLSRYGCP